MARYTPLFYRGAPASIPQVVAHLQKAMSEEDPDYTPLRQRMPPASIPDIVAHIQKYLTENVFVTMEDLGEDIAQYIEDHPEIVGVATVNGATGNVILDAGNIPLETGEDPTIAGAISYLSSQLALLVADAVMSVNGVTPDDSHDVTLTGADITQDANTSKKLSETFGPATSQAAGTKGLVPAPQAGDENKVLSGSGAWVDQASGGGSVSKVCNVSPDSQGNVPLKGSDIPLQSMSLQTVAQAIAAASTVFTGATSQAAGAKGQVPAPAAGEDGHVLSGSGDWVTGSGIATSDTDDTPIDTTLSTLNDQKANEISNAIVCNSNTAPQDGIPAKSYYYHNGVLYYTNDRILSGETVPSQNSIEQAEGGLNSFRPKKYTVTTTSPYASANSVELYEIGPIITVSKYLRIDTEVPNDGTFAITTYHPAQTIYGILFNIPSQKIAGFKIDTSGNIKAEDGSIATGWWTFFCCVPK